MVKESMILHINKTKFQAEHIDTSGEIIVTSQALGTLRSDLIETLGLENAKKLLLNLGNILGVTDGQLMRKRYLSIQEQINEGPIRHSKQGHIKGAIFEGFVEYDEDETIKSIHGKGTWIHSFEAQEHLKRFGVSTDTGCYILAGYASGYMSTVCQLDVEVVEKTCVSKGDAECTWEIHTVMPQIIDQLNPAREEVTFDLVELNTFQNKMIQAITDGATIEEILKQAEKTFHRSFVVEDIFYNLAHAVGLQDYEKQKIQQDMLAYDQQERHQLGDQFFERRQQLVYSKKVMQLKNHSRLTNTIVIRNKVVAYYSIVSLHQKSFSDNDLLILSKMTNVISLLLMADQIKTNSYEADENHFLQNLLLKRYGRYEEILSKSRFFNININELYTVAILRWKMNTAQIQKEIEQFIRRQFQQYRLLFTTQNQELVLLLFHHSNDEQKIDSKLHSLSNKIEAQFPKYPFQLGYSAIGDNILEVHTHYYEASLSIVSQPNAQITAFNDISILSILINDSNSELIKQIAKHKFAPFLSLKQAKRTELLQTLYIFLNTGMKIEATMRTLSISKSGLLYRLEKIKEYLGSELKEPNENFQLLLLLKAIEISYNANGFADGDFDIEL